MISCGNDDEADPTMTNTADTQQNFNASVRQQLAKFDQVFEQSCTCKVEPEGVAVCAEDKKITDTQLSCIYSRTNLDERNALIAHLGELDRISAEIQACLNASEMLCDVLDNCMASQEVPLEMFEMHPSLAPVNYCTGPCSEPGAECVSCGEASDELVPADFLCDGGADCANGFDEANCE